MKLHKDAKTCETCLSQQLVQQSAQTGRQSLASVAQLKGGIPEMRFSQVKGNIPLQLWKFFGHVGSTIFHYNSFLFDKSEMK